MMKKIMTTVALAAVMTLTGCATQKALLHTSTAQSTANKTTHHFFIAGLGQEKTIDAAQVCGGASRVAGVESTETAKDVLLSVVTLGIYTPRTATVYCK